MIDYVIYNAEGLITETGRTIEAMLELQADPDKGRFLAEGAASIASDWVVDGIITPRPALPCTVSASAVSADGDSVVTIAGLPAGASIEIFGPTTGGGTADGNDIALTFAIPGAYRIALRLFPYLDREETIHAV